MNGILLVDKPVDWTSFDVVNYIRRIVAQAEGKKPKNVKVGHSGTLDPFATGLLVLMIGKEFTKRATELSKLDKTYEATMKLGFTSSTGDSEGEIKPSSSVVPSKQEIEAALRKFTGEIKQTPPIHSAIKINGQRAYKLAREGKQVDMESRIITIKSLDLASYSYPNAKLIANVSSGTYIRSLVEDIGNFLEAGAYTEQLRRLSVGKFKIEDAVEVKSINAESLLSSLRHDLNL